MKCVILAAVVALAVAAPSHLTAAPPAPAPAGYGYQAPSEAPEVVQIVRDDRSQANDGTYSVDVEAENGIVLSQSGTPTGPEGAVVASGQYSYIAPDGTPIEVKFVADENGYQPDSAVLPVAPEFPHEIPQFVHDQIAKAAEEDAAEAQGGYGPPAPAPTYG